MIRKIYDYLIEEYGPQGWWPLLLHDGTNPTKSGAINGYHPGDYSFPKNDRERFEICLGAILTQNTSWPQVEKALIGLEEIGGIDATRLLELDDEIVKEKIKPAGYFNQKCRYMKNFAEFFLSGEEINRESVLGVKGIGNETCDSILLYAYGKEEFVVDAYTKRIFGNLGLVRERDKYMDIKTMFEDELRGDLIVYQEYHALIVEHAKRFYRKKEDWAKDPLLKIIC